MKKYAQGEKITNLDELAKQRLVYWRGKIYCSGWIFNWQFIRMIYLINNGELYKAVKIGSDDEG